MGHHKTFNDETHIPLPVIKRAQMVATLCAGSWAWCKLRWLLYEQ